MPIERRPSEGFSHLIERFWLLPRKGGTGESPLEILPDGHFSLGFGISETGCRIFAGGPCTKAVLIQVADFREFFVVRFRPGKWPRLLDARPADLVDRVAEDLPGFLGLDRDELGERLLGADGLEAKQRLLEALFHAKGVGALCQDRRCRQAVERVEAVAGQITVSVLARELGLSTRTLERLFLAQIGLSPKRFIRNLRFQGVVARLRSPGPRRTLGELAYASGYADQTHFINDFKDLAGRLPRSFVSRLHDTGGGGVAQPGV
jgi:AraC-like DNA-binding protein